MSAAFHLKQKIYQQSPKESVTLLSKYYSLKHHEFSISTTQKAYKCFECCILVNDQKHCAGFGRNEEEAILNAGRIALESIIDSGDQSGLQRAMEPDDAELNNLITRLSLDDAEALKRERVSIDSLSKMSAKTIRNFLPPVEARKVFEYFHPQELNELKALNEVSCK